MTFEIGKLLAASTVAGGLMASAAMAETKLRMMWYNDGNEGEVMQSLLDRFEAANPDISVTLDVVPISRSSRACRFNWQRAPGRTLRASRTLAG